jgi:hypothetical protein
MDKLFVIATLNDNDIKQIFWQCTSEIAKHSYEILMENA